MKPWRPLSLQRMLRDRGWAATYEYIREAVDVDVQRLFHPAVSDFVRQHAQAIAAYINGGAPGMSIVKRINAPKKVGGFYAWKAVLRSRGAGCVLVLLWTPEDAHCVRRRGVRKMRVSHAVVVDMWAIEECAVDKDGYRCELRTRWTYTCRYAGKKVKTGVSCHDTKFRYRVGETVRPSNGFNDHPFAVCAPGIHCYRTEKEALAHFLHL